MVAMNGLEFVGMLRDGNDGREIELQTLYKDIGKELLKVYMARGSRPETVLERFKLKLGETSGKSVVNARLVFLFLLCYGIK
jgi:hypothetical protein